ncbi:hypothetical protein V493_00619 [Pseudogymnoascus sp. VKM F-4281 (FW-2241)]|nr:hypothetical protein V493_00619 [Pseudogymnoascus sp. VKM F-4281 (FW-2241)]
MKYLFHFYIFSVLEAWLTLANSKLICHDEAFHPDIVLQVTSKVICQACTSRYGVVVNGTTPGPTLSLREGKTTWIRVYNDMSEQNLTMHWHGLSAAASPFSDGSPQASQWPIPLGSFFDYELNPEEGDAGTYFYHSHVGLQALSTNGPLIVRDSERPPFEYDDERIILLTDYFNKTDSEIVNGLTANPFVWSGESEAILVNGFGTIDNATTGDASCSLAALQAKTKQQLDKENRLQYFLQLESRERPTLTRSYALITYSTGGLVNIAPPAVPPLTLHTATYDWLEDQLRPLVPNCFPSREEVTRRVTIHVQQILNGSIIWTQNGLPWTESFPKMPYLVALYLDNATTLPSYDVAVSNGLGMDPRVRAFPARIGEVLEIVIQNSGATNGALDVHPFHAHGSHFYDIGSGNGTYDANANLCFLSLLFFCSFAACRALTSALSKTAEYVITCAPLTRQLIASLIEVGELF